MSAPIAGVLWSILQVIGATREYKLSGFSALAFAVILGGMVVVGAVSRKPYHAPSFFSEVSSLRPISWHPRLLHDPFRVGNAGTDLVDTIRIDALPKSVQRIVKDELSPWAFTQRLVDSFCTEIVPSNIW
ncbi:hypothetical protein M427DRAFT_68353, partial [Gonapodya prolifera JEL478]